MARVCSGVKKDALDALRTKPEMLTTSESFLKSTLRHYKLQMDGASMQLILHARAKLYYRVGRMMVAWPQNHVKLQQSLASIESKYCGDLVAAKALSLVFTTPVLVNSKPLHEDDILVFPRKSTFQIPSPDDEIEDAA